MRRLHATGGDARFADWLAARRAYMVRRGWRAPGDQERDAYDDDAATAQLVLYGGDGLVLGLRLTPVESLDRSMSWRMVRDSRIHSRVSQETVRRLGRVWDLTRLVPGPGRGGDDVILRLLLAGLRHCRTSGDDDPVWVFAIDRLMRRWLRRHEVPVLELGRGRVGADAHETILAAARPAEVHRRRGGDPPRSSSTRRRTMPH